MTPARRRYRLFGVPIDNLTMREAVAEIEKLIGTPGPSLVFTPNTQHLSLLRRQPDFRAAYAAADLVLPDSTPLIWSSRLLGCPLRERVAGADIPDAFCAVAAPRRYGLFFLGAAPGVAERAADSLTRKNPGLRVAGVYSPPVGFEENRELDEEVVRRIRAARPDVLFVALGTPKGEVWAWRHREAAGVPVAVCCGAALDFISGNKKRAPRSVQRLGLEWLYRVVHEPRRLWKRYLVCNTHFVILLAKEFMRRNHTGKRA
jgi:N-acetylglucosaminyldiphosphoundecaprenol N-acetyl-beta-D-mannosaminyltransferase